MITQINNSNTDEFLHWYLITAMDDCVGHPFNSIVNNPNAAIVSKINATIQSPPEWNSLRSVYNRCINFTNLDVYLTHYDYSNQS